MHALDKKLSEILNSGEEEHQFEVAWWQMNDISDLGVIHKIGNFDPRLQKIIIFFDMSIITVISFYCLITTLFIFFV